MGERKRGIVAEVLHSLIALKGQGAQVLHDSIQEERTVRSRTGKVYGPRRFPTVRTSVPEGGLQDSSDSRHNGPLTPAEAVGVRVLHTEASALAQSFGRSITTSIQVRNALGPREDAEWQRDVIDNIGFFGNQVGIAAGVRARARGEQERAKPRTMVRGFDQIHDARYLGPLRQDGMTIGVHTAQAIEQALIEQAEEHIPNNPGGARNGREVQARIRGCRLGAQLARQIYLESSGLASSIIDSKKKG